MGPSILINWTSPFPILGVYGVFFHFYSISNRYSCWQTVKTLIRRRILRRLIWVCTVWLCPKNGTLDLYGLFFERKSILKYVLLKIGFALKYLLIKKGHLDSWKAQDTFHKWYKKTLMQSIKYAAKIVFIWVLFYLRSFEEQQAYGPHLLTWVKTIIA